MVYSQEKIREQSSHSMSTIQSSISEAESNLDVKFSIELFRQFPLILHQSITALKF